MSIQYATSPDQAAADCVEETWKRNSFPLNLDSRSRASSEVIENLEETSKVLDIYRLSYMLSSLFATILEDAITELRILAGSNNELRVCKTLDDINLLRAIKYDIEQPVVTDELEGIIPAKISCDTYKLKKLDNDRELFGDTLVATYLELSNNRNYKGLVEKIKLRTDAYDHRINIADEETRNRATRRELARQLRHLRNHIKSVNYDTNIIIERLKTKVEDSALDVEVRTRYSDNCERARFEQHAQTITDVEAPPSEAIEVYKQHIDQEQRVHVEVEMLINICINETLRKVESWMNKYDKDIEAIDLKIQIKKNEHELTLERREELEKMLEKHEEEMKSWIHFKDEREKVRLYREKIHRSASIVQAWWRGLLVRLQLGPYKVVKKPTKSGAKKK